MTEAQEQKEEGNKLFAAGKFEEAIACYTKALKICPADEKKDKAVYFKNRSQCHLKLENYNAAANDASKGSGQLSSIVLCLDIIIVCFL